MLKINREQMLAIQPVAETAFVKRVVAAVRKNHADVAVHLPTDSTAVEQLSDEVLEEMVRTTKVTLPDFDAKAWEPA